MANNEYSHALAQLHSEKVRLTPQRKVILQYLMSHHTHPSAEMVFSALKENVDNLSVATVYNTLKLFVDHGLVIELKNGDGSTHFDYFGHPHYHIVCDNCGKITDVFDDEFTNISDHMAKTATQKTNYLVTGNQVELHGICPECQKKLHLDRLK